MPGNLAVHERGDRRADWVAEERRTRAIILVSGQFTVRLPERTVVLAQHGDYVVFHGVSHSWEAETACVVVGVRWPSIPGYQPPAIFGNSCAAIRAGRLARRQRYACPARTSWGGTVMAGQDEISAAAAGFGHLRASHTDRDQVIGILKTAFVQGRLTKDEFDQRVSGTFASRTYADLAAITADLPVWLIRAEPPRQPATARDARPVEARAAQPVNKPLMWGAVAVVVAGVLAGVAAFPANSASMLAAGVFAILVGAPVAGTLMLDSWHANHPARPLPSRPARGIKAPSDRRGRIGDDLSLAAKPG